jgi:transposase
MTKPYSLAFKEKMLERLTGKGAVSAAQLGREMGIPQQTLSNWLQNARSIPLVAEKHSKAKALSIDEKVRVLAEAASLSGAALGAMLSREGLSLGQWESWRLALEDESNAAAATTKRIRMLERELVRKEKALAEAAALLLLQKKAQFLWEDADDDTDHEGEKGSSR